MLRNSNDLIADPTEEHNIAEQEPEVRRELSRRLAARYLEGTWYR